MTVHEILNVINETDIVYYAFGDGIRGSASDLSACLCEEALNDEVDYIAIGGTKDLPVIEVRIK